MRNDTPVLREVLRLTYDPYIKYGINRIPQVLSHRNDTLESQWPHINHMLMCLAEGHGSNELKDMLAGIMQNLRKDDANLLACIVRKDLKAGITATTINKVFPGLVPVFGIMKAQQFKESLWHPDLMGSVKLDGYRCLVRDGQLLSSGGHIISGADHILRALAVVPDCDFDGEIMVPSMNFQEGGGAIRSASVTPDAKLFIFDFINSPHTPFKDRYKTLVDIGEKLKWSFSLAKPDTITVVKHRKFTNLAEMYDTFNKSLTSGYEGLVLKDPNSTYVQKRSKAWLKVKNVLDEDCQIIGFYEGEGKYEDSLGGVLVQRNNGYRSRVGGGFSDAQRTNIWLDKEAYLGKTIEVHYMEDTPDGDFRHARFKRFRPEKDK